MARKLLAALAAQIISTIKVSPSADPAKTRGVDHRALETDILHSVLLPEYVMGDFLASDLPAFVADGAAPGWRRVTDVSGGVFVEVVTALSGTTYTSTISPLAFRESDGARGTYDLDAGTFTADADPNDYT